MYSRKYKQVLARVNFPIYSVQCFTDRHVLVAGGGGGAKTGIRNVIEIYELINVGSTCRAECVCHYETGNEAVMNCTVFCAGKYYLLFAGMEGNCQIYKIRHEVVDLEMHTNEEAGNDVSSLRKRNTLLGSENENQSRNPSSSHSKLLFNIQPLESFQTDFSKEPFQKLVKFSPITKLLVTGGADGHVRLWKHPYLNLEFDIAAHTDDVDDLDICPQGKMVATVSRDGHGKIWNTENSNLMAELTYTLPSKSNSDGKYIFRSCRFAKVEDTDNLTLFGAINPAARKNPPLQSYLCKWDTKKFSLEKIVSTGNDLLSAMAVSDNGHFLALGTQSGSVKIFIAFSLQNIYSFDCVHGIFVTSIHFLPTSEESRRITGGHEASLVSVSVDNHIILHHVPNRASMSFLTLITLFILTLFLVFVIMDFFNL